MTKSRLILLCLITTMLTISGLGAQTVPRTPTPVPDPNCEQEPVVRTPLDQVVPQCMANRRQTRDPVELIAQDLNVCKCLEDGNALFPEALTPQNSTDEQTRSLQALSRSTANNQALSAIAGSSSQRNLESRLIVGTGEMRGRIATPVPDSVLSRLSPEKRESSMPRISDSITQVDTIPESRRDNQCVTYMEYSAQRELPYDNSFFAFLGSTSTFREDDWKVETLRAAYDATTNVEQRRSIVARMVFLSRNPQYSALFRAQTVEGVTPAVIAAKKTELFNIMRRLAPASGSNCAATENLCWREAQGSGAYREFSQAAETFLLNNDVVDIVSAQSATDYEAEVVRLSSDTRVPTTARGYSDYLQSEQQDIAFGCSGPSAEASCYERFALHCNRVRRISSRAAQSNSLSGSEIIEELTSAQKVHGLLNPNQNMNFESFNDLVCLQNYQNASGESSNFFAFRTRVCSGASPAPECSDRRQLVGRFLREYNVGTDAADLNVRAGFADALGRPRFLAVSQIQVDAVNRITETPRELRARFNGGYPSISPTGQLVPAQPSSSSRTPAVADQSSRSSSSSSAALADTQRPADSRSAQTSESRERAPERRRPQSDTSEFDDSSRQPIRQPQAEFSGSPMRRSPTLPVIQPQTPQQPVASTPTPERRPASTSEQDDNRDQRPGPTPGLSQVSVQTGGGSSVASGEGNQRSAGAQPIIEMPRRRSSRSQAKMNDALLQKYENVSVDPATRVQQELLNRPAVPVSVTPEIISSVVNDPAVLASQESVLQAVNASSEQVVKLSLETEGGSPVVVYASKENGGVTFSFTPPVPAASDRSPASLGDNEMNVRLQSGIYQQVRDNPSALSGFDNVVRSAMSLPGDVVRLNILSEGSDPISVYVDKRGPRPVFTANDPQVIGAYRP